jgi:TolB-like protein
MWGVLAVVLVSVAVGVITLRKPEPAAIAVETKPVPAPTAVPRVSDKSIAVLPFANLSAEKENEFFADGVHDDVITSLAKIRDLKIISRTSVLAYRDTASRNLKKIAADLGVATVLEGSVRRVGDKVHMNAQLIDARTDEHLWAETYDGDASDIFALQAKLAQQIAAALKATLTPGERTSIERRPTENQEAYELYLRARILDQNLAPGATKEEYERVLGFYEQAAAMDPAFALPHIQASILHGTMYWFAGLDATPARRAKSLAEVDVAKRLAPAAPETLLAQGSFDYTCRNDWARALAEYRAAEAGLPNDAQLHYRIGLAHRRLGQWPEALARLERAAVLDPNYSEELIQLTGTVFFLRRYPQVLALTNRYLALFPDERALQAIRISTRYGLDGDRAAYLRALAALPAAANDTNGLFAAYIVAMLTGDLAAADRVLADPRMTSVVNIDGSINDPVDLHRAFVAWLHGRPDEARRFADEAIAAYQRQKWVPRQEPWVQLGVARAEAYAGRMDDAMRDGKAALDAEIARDAFSALYLRNEYGRILVVGNRREEALATLREMMNAPCGLSSNDIRFDPLWSRLKDDPRFEEILRSAKPL